MKSNEPYAGGGGEKQFFQNVEIRVENCWGDYLIVKEAQFTKKEEKTPDLIYVF